MKSQNQLRLPVACHPENDIDCISRCSYTVDFGPHVTTSAGMMPLQVKRDNNQCPCASCPWQEERQRLLSEVEARQSSTELNLH